MDMAFWILALVVQAPPVVRLEALVELLLRHNPEVAAARYRHEAATKRPSQESALPEPKLSYTNFGVGHPFSRLGNDFAYRGVGVMQEVPFPGKRALAREQAAREADAERDVYREMSLERVAQLKAAYYEWYAAWKALDISAGQRDLLAQLEQTARARYSVGRAAQQDVLKAQLERSALEQRKEIFDQKRLTAEARLRALINHDLPAGRPEEIGFQPLAKNADEIINTMEQASPRLGAARSTIESRAVGIERARKDYRPDFGFSFQWQKTGSQFPDYYMATAEVKIPLYFWRKQRLAVEESVARLRESRSSYEAARLDLAFQVKDLYFAARAGERLIELYRSGILPQASLTLDSAMAGYQVGNVDFLTVIAAFNGVLDYQMQYYDEIAKHASARARLEALAPEGRF
jgi:cobalt-zinc-cadmium efflux system outer membrane protein